MRINNSNQTTFGVNLNSPKLKYHKKDFFVNIPGYGKNYLWAGKAVKAADNAVDLIRQDAKPEDVLKSVAEGIRSANQFCLETRKRQETGLLRTARDGWPYAKRSFQGDLVTNYTGGRYYTYKARLDHTSACEPVQRVYKNIAISRPDNIYGIIVHGNPGFINSSLDYVFSLCEKIFPKFIHKDVKPKDMNTVNDTIAEIRWVLAHSTPWSRGSDAIANVFMRAIYKAIGVKAYPLEKNVSLDMEAYCTQLDDYKKEFPYFFEKQPEIIE